MILTFFYMVATWVQAWRLSSLRTRLAAILQNSNSPTPTIVFYINSIGCVNQESSVAKSASSHSNGSTDSLSSELCNNRSLAKLGDLLWYQGDKQLCSVYPQQKVNVSDWLKFPLGKTVFPLCMHNYSKDAALGECRMHVLVEAKLDHYNPTASIKATKLEDYGTVVAWTSNTYIALILEMDLDYLTKLSTALMHGQQFINNGLYLTRVQSVVVDGKPCVYNSDKLESFHKNKLIGKAQWNAQVKKLRIFSSTARIVSQQGIPIEVEETPGVYISPGNETPTLHAPTILEITIPSDTIAIQSTSDAPFPSTPPPTPASASAVINGTVSRLSQELSGSLEFSPTSSLDAPTVLSVSPSPSKSHDLALVDSVESNLTKSVVVIDSIPPECLDVVLSDCLTKTPSPKSLPLTSTANYSPSKKAVTGSGNYAKPPNILLYADSTIAIDNVKRVLEAILNRNKYTIYTLSSDEACSDVWMDQARLVVVCGNVGVDVASQLVEYMVRGGRLLALCSDTLHTLLPTFKTAEVREHELVRFSYGKWKHVRMMHHIFCYQASPAKSRFSQDHEDVKVSAPMTPASANVRDKAGKTHTFHVRVLGSEETWHTPSLLLANLPATGGKAVFSQIHLEVDPSQYEFEESKFSALKQSNSARLEIFSDLLSSHLGMDVCSEPRVLPAYSPGFFLGRHELKLEMLEKLKDRMLPNDIIKTGKLEIQFCGRSTQGISASASVLPVMIHQCPDNFSTVEYFENLSSEELGRLVIYADVMTSSMDVVANCQLHHGLAVIPCQQVSGQGRSKNVWLSPKGCGMFTLQLHIALNSVLGGRLSLIQHLVAAAIVSAIKSIPGYEDIDLRLKWPNDIYAGSTAKIGGLIVTSLIESETAICNIGVGVNLSNSEPTCCINDLITRHNDQYSTNLPKLTAERYFALVFSELERILNVVQTGNMNHFYEIYYEYWMHTDSEVVVVSPEGTSQEVKILGIDDYGFLQVCDKGGEIFTVHPDGNSFDILKGLIAPK
ncbi:biotin--protein ligase isoform X1 [Neodiprion lecontei]|uniref:Biotin--protein ligase n=1 Tax=Neodiprion lecontei TaxID=441921 RepID=A0A6J0BJ72_NEOLC|nr:biotin--protein ligase isoform X1 [Neodiprion lecontei]XP_015514596.1 biotin--protein ligase isoform X1 [Neodiprion lecontei]